MLFGGKSTILTGGSLGIGLAMSRAFAAEGANLVIASNDEAEFENVKDIAKEDGVRIEAIKTDVSQPNEVKRMVDFTVEQYGTVDILVNCAGIYGPIGIITENNIEHWLDTININLYGTFLCMRAVLPFMMQKKKGKIINMAGGGGASPLPRFSAYGASKAGVIRLTETIAEEVNDYNIDINAIAPGAVNTRLLDQALAAGDAVGGNFRTKILKQKDDGGVPPEKVAELAVFLASSESDGLSGKLIALLWDNWKESPQHLREIMSSDVYAMRRITPKERGYTW